jgi:hypothetical protein
MNERNSTKKFFPIGHILLVLFVLIAIKPIIPPNVLTVIIDFGCFIWRKLMLLGNAYLSTQKKADEYLHSSAFLSIYFFG